ncbi:flippase [Flavobacterium cellulosilyticum]|uniref:Flippase n=1 Tax=Flavobacterium cellulosilyticum TaxID=2541731 RepID=A0A4R5CJ52_9FLAO|nr:flippase [Flavobacterium cellulosilyticum]TDD98353.1 flippase [Flavobacterium cellulosilyticum]
MKKIKNKLKEHKSIIENFSYLSVLQVFNMILPLLSYPYLIRVLGTSIYGKIIFAQAIIGYLALLVGFGFSITATKEISVHREDKEKLSEIVCSVLVIKTLLLIVSFVFFLPLLFFYNQVAENKVLYFMTLWLCIYEIMFPVFYFQGIEKMKYVSIISLIVRCIFVALIFVFIHNKTDYLYVPLLNLFGAVLAGMSSMYIVFYKHKIRFYIPEFAVLKFYFKEAIPVFLSNISIQIYVSTNKVLIGSFLGMTEVSYYDLGEKILNILRIPQGIISQSVFPKISLDKNISFINKVFKYSLAFNTALFLLLVVFSDMIIRILGGVQMLPAKGVVIILGLTLPIVAISNVFGILVMIPFGLNKLFSKIIMFSGVIFILQFLFLWIFNFITIYSLCTITVVTELFVSFLMYYYCLKNNLWTIKSTTI